MKKIIGGAAALVGSVGAMAQTSGGTSVDTSSITAALTTVGTVGTAVFAVYVGVRVFKWIRSAL